MLLLPQNIRMACRLDASARRAELGCPTHSVVAGAWDKTAGPPWRIRRSVVTPTGFTGGCEPTTPMGLTGAGGQSARSLTEGPKSGRNPTADAVAATCPPRPLALSSFFVPPFLCPLAPGGCRAPTGLCSPVVWVSDAPSSARPQNPHVAGIAKAFSFHFYFEVQLTRPKMNHF